MPPRIYPNDPDEPRIFEEWDAGILGTPDEPDEPRAFPQPPDSPGQEPGLATDPVPPQS
jgi:hypothetical protein